MVGLGRMGANMVRRLLGAGHECVVFDIHPQAALDLAKSVSDSGEGRWTLKAAIDEGVPAPVLSTALTQRFASRGARTSPTSCSPRCAISSADMRRSPDAACPHRQGSRPNQRPL